MILAGDFGGTKINLGLFDSREGRLHLLEKKGFLARDFDDPEVVLETFLSGTGRRPDRVCLGVAGLVKSGRAELTNLPWVISAHSLKRRFGTDRVWLLNDLAALAGSVPYLDEKDIGVLQEGNPHPEGRVAVIAAGTGLGQAFLIPETDGRHRILDTEGGQCDFAPRDATEVELLKFLQAESGRVSLEWVLSGPGLVRLYQFFRSLDAAQCGAGQDAVFQGGDSARIISQRALEEPSGPHREALDRFVSIYGAAAGNLALQILARGGVYVGGGIAPKIWSHLNQGTFMASFLDKGGFRKLLEEIPVRVILNPEATLLGAAGFALQERLVD